MATVSTTFTFSSTDISSDALSFTVSENLALTGSGGIIRFNLNAKYTGAMADPNQFGPRSHNDAYEIYAGSGSSNQNNPSGSVPTFLYLKNVTGSGFSASAGAMSTASYVHLYISGAGNHPITQSTQTVAVVPQGGFTYIPINPDNSYFIFAADHTGSEGNITASTIVEFGVFN